MATLPVRAAQTAAILVAGWMVLLQFVLTPETQAPWAIFAIVLLGWLVALALLSWRPTLGAPFAALLGVAGAFGSLRTHAAGYENWALIALSVAAAAAGAWATVTARRSA